MIVSAVAGLVPMVCTDELATVRKADRILVIENGEIIEAGTHPELLNKTGRYAQFYAWQFSQEF